MHYQVCFAPHREPHQMTVLAMCCVGCSRDTTVDDLGNVNTITVELPSGENTTDDTTVNNTNEDSPLEATNNVEDEAVENATDEIYNSEWVAGGFSARAPGRIWGIDFRYNF